NNSDILAMMDDVQKVVDMPAVEEEDTATAGRHQVINRYILQLLYGDALVEMATLTKNGVVYRSDDMGESWKKMTEYKISGGSAVLNGIEAGYTGRIEVDPNNENILYGVEVRVMKSEDGGKTFKSAPWNGNHGSHVDTRGIWIDPLNSNHILNLNDGGVNETWDGGLHWSQKETISAQQFYDISVDSEFPYNVMGGTQDNGCWMGPSRNRNQYGVFPADWTYLPSGDGYYVVRDWWNPEYVYYESQFGRSSRMNLKTGQSISLQVRNTQEENAAGEPAQRYQWDSPIFLSPHNPGIVYIASQHVFRSYQRGEPGTFEKISPDLSKADKTKLAESRETNLQWATVYTFAESPVKPGVLWAGTDDGNLQLSKDAGVSWINITDKFYDSTGKLKKNTPKGAMLPYDRWVSRVEPSNHDVNVCYVTYSGYRSHTEDTSYIYVTRDMGETWEDLSGGMMNPVRDINEDPDNPNVLYIGTDYGVFVSIDSGKNWTNISEDAPDVIIMDMDIQERERDLALATYGRGFYIIDIFPFKEFSTEVLEEDAHLFDVQRTIKWNMLERRGESYGEFAVSPNPPTEAAIYYNINKEAKSVKLSIKDLEGNLLTEVSGKGDPGLHKAVWNLRGRPTQTGGQQQMGRRGPSLVEAGTYKVTLIVDDIEVVTKKFKVEDDPILK
ncbi:WD40/YVTN/BNR-like repeat-containing protein, partial [Acidobacteriota bacterium]